MYIKENSENIENDVENYDREFKSSALLLTILTENFELSDAKAAICPMMISSSYDHFIVIMKNPVKKYDAGVELRKVNELK